MEAVTASKPTVLDIIKTPLRKLASTSQGRNKWALEQALAAGDPGVPTADLSARLAVYLTSAVGRSYDHNGALEAAERAHVERAIKAMLIKKVRGAGFVRHAKRGDVGIIYGASYSVTVGQRTNDPEEVAPHLLFGREDGTERRVSMHVNIVWPNGFYTTCPPQYVELLPDEEGRIAFVAQYWDGPAAWDLEESKPKKRADRSAGEMTACEPA